MRVIGGSLKGKNLVSPIGQATRPTTDRVRESIFNILSNRLDFDRIRVVDLFAGTGAMGIEALSRGAEYCLFVENAPPALTAIRRNIELLDLTAVAKISRRSALKLATDESQLPYQLAFADPPYGKGFGELVAAELSNNRWLSDNAIFILEENRHSMPDKLNNFMTIDLKRYGDTAIGVFEYVA